MTMGEAITTYTAKGKKKAFMYGNTKIEYKLEFRSRKTLAIEVYPDSSVHVIAPLNAAQEAIDAKLLKRAKWIRKQQHVFSQIAKPLPKRQYVSGESYRYLGKQYKLKVNKNQLEKRIRLYQGKLEVFCVDEETVPSQLEDWLRQRASIIFKERFDLCLAITKTHGINHTGSFSLKYMPTRWGSCTKAGKIQLNPLLVAAPKECIDYVIIHELCHTVEHNHSKAFFKKLAKCLPDYEKRKEKLNQKVEVFDLKNR